MPNALDLMLRTLGPCHLFVDCLSYWRTGEVTRVRRQGQMVLPASGACLAQDDTSIIYWSYRLRQPISLISGFDYFLFCEPSWKKGSKGICRNVKAGWMRKEA